MREGRGGGQGGRRDRQEKKRTEWERGKERGRERGREGAEPWQRAVVEKMPCFVERILPGQEGEVRQSTEGALLPGKPHTHTLTHTPPPYSPPPSTPSHLHTHILKCYVVNGSATICSWDESDTCVVMWGAEGGGFIVDLRESQEAAGVHFVF